MTRSHAPLCPRGPFLGLLACALAACGGGADEPGGGAGASEGSGRPERPEPAGDGAKVDLAELAQGSDEGTALLFEARERTQAEWKADNIRRRDPGADGWRSEQLHDRAKKALKVFLHAVVHSNGDGPAWGELLADTFRGATTLRPAELERVFDDGAMRVLKPGSIDGELRPPSELGQLLSDALAPFEGAEDLDAAFKIIKIDVDGERFETTVKVETDGLVDGAPIQQNSDWRVGWVATEDDASVLIESVRLLAYEEVHTSRGLFGELTGHVFGDHPFWDREFRLGIADYYFKLDKMTGNAFIGGQGVAVGDVDGDGLDDVYVCQQGGLPNRLFLHQPDGTAVDVAQKAGVAFLDNTRGVLIVDLDNDGNQDLALAIKNNVVLCYGDGEGGFGGYDALVGKGDEDIFSLSAADPDLDGDLDLYACRYVKNGILGGVPTPYHDANNGSTNLFWVNEGGREFSSGMFGWGLSSNNKKFSLASIWEDLDVDGDPDLYVTNDFGRNNLYRNDGERFHDVAIEMGADDMAAGMGASSADIDLDGWPDLLVTNMFSSAGLRIASIPDQFMGGEHREVHQRYVRHARGNTLLCNRGDGSFDDVTELAGVAVGRWGWGARFVELNNDGLEDIYVPNGFITNRDPEDV